MGLTILSPWVTPNLFKMEQKSPKYGPKPQTLTLSADIMTVIVLARLVYKN